MCGLKQQPICASLCDGDPIIFACLKQVLHFLQPRLATLTSLAEFCIFQPARSRLQHFSARPPAWFSGRLKSPGFRQAGSLAARQAQPSFSLLRLCSPSGGCRQFVGRSFPQWHEIHAKEVHFQYLTRSLVRCYLAGYHAYCLSKSKLELHGVLR